MRLSYYSYLLLGIVLWAVVSFGITRVTRLPGKAQLALSLLIGGILIAAWFIVRPTETSTVATADEAEQLIGGGKPVVLEFFSEY